MSAVPDNLDPTAVISVKGVHRLRRESGVTLLMVAVGMFAMLSVAILTLDVVNLYMASNQAQRAADAAALAGAQALASSGTTTNWPTPIPLNSVCNGSTGNADTRAQAVAAQNLIAGLPPTSVITSCTAPAAYNPQIQVTVTRTGIPAFLAGMFGRSTNSVTATALAEAYNPQNPSGGYPPIAIYGVKPWAVYEPPGTTYTYGEALTLKPIACTPIAGTPLLGQFCAIDGPAPIACPSSNAISCTQVGTGGLGNYLDNIACENGSTFTNGQTIGPGQTFQQDPGPVGPGTAVIQDTVFGTQCLIHSSGGTGQDILTPTVPVTIAGGSYNPNSALQGVSNISRSDSVVTVPTFNTSGSSFAIGGFLQLGIRDVNSDGTIDTLVLNVVHWDPTSTGTPITGAGTSPVTVRLIH